MIRTLAWWSAMCLVSSAAGVLAGEPDEAARKAGEALAGKFKEFDPALCGTSRFTLMNGEKAAGSVTMVVEKAPEGSGGAYRLRFETETIAPAGSSMVHEEVLDASFALVSLIEERRLSGRKATRRLRREGDVWSCETVEFGQPRELRIAYYEIFQPDENYPDDEVIIWKDPGRTERAFLLAPKTRVEVLETVDGDRFGSPHLMYRIKTADGRTGWVPKAWCKQVYKEPEPSVARTRFAFPNHGEQGSAWMLARALAEDGPGQVLLKGIRWADVPKSEGASAGVSGKGAVDLLVDAGESKPFAHRGKEVAAVTVRISVLGETTGDVVVVGPGRGVLAFWVDYAPGPRLVAGTEEEVKADLAAAAPAPPGGMNREAVVRVYKAYMGILLQATREKKEVPNQESMDEAARANGFKNWQDFAAQAAKALAPEDWKKAVDEVTKWYEGEVRKLAEEAAREAAEREKRQPEAYYEICNADPTTNEVVVWTDVGEEGVRAFVLRPGTRVEVLETAVKEVYHVGGFQRRCCRIRTSDRREGWILEFHCRLVRK